MYKKICFRSPVKAEHSTPKANTRSNRHRKRRKRQQQTASSTSYTTVAKRSQRPCRRPTGIMSANFNPYVQGWRVNNESSSRGHGEPPSIFGALPMTSGANPNAAASASAPASRGGQGQAPDPNATVFHITDFRPNVLNASVVDAQGRQWYKIVTDAPQQPQRTVYYDAQRRTVAIVDWAGSRPSVEMPGLLPRQSLRTWLHTGPDRAYVPLSSFWTWTRPRRADGCVRCLDPGLWTSEGYHTSGFPMGNSSAYVFVPSSCNHLGLGTWG